MKSNHANYQTRKQNKSLQVADKTQEFGCYTM